MLQKKISRTSWRSVIPVELHQSYEQVENKLKSKYGNELQARRSVNYLYQFTTLFTGGSGDFTNMTACFEDVQKAITVWDEMQRIGGWTAKHIVLVRTSLSRGLAEVVEGLSVVVNPVNRPGRSSMFRTKRSQIREFNLHDCIPKRIRSEYKQNQTEYSLLDRLGREFAEYLSSVSKGHMQRILVFLDMIILKEPALVRSNGAYQDIETQWSDLRHISPEQWLDAYLTKRKQTGPCSFTVFTMEIRFLRILHEKVLNSHKKQLVTIPKIGASGCWTTADGENDDNLNSSGSSFGSSASSSEEEASARNERKKLKGLLAKIQNEVCQQKREESCTFDLDPDEVRRSLRAADTRLERLVVVLFMTWGLRIGGLCRLQLTGESNCLSIRQASDVPVMLITTEKNQKIRRIGPLNEICKHLIAEWCTLDRPSVSNAYIFPSSSGKYPHMSTSRIWRLCNTIFVRAGLDTAKSNIHPHAFRHTVVHMMYQCGASFEAIAKWIGHSNVKTTSNVYGRLRQEETNDLISKVCPHMAASASNGSVERWKELARFLQNPFNVQLSVPVPCTPRRTSREQIKRRVRETLSTANNSGSDSKV